MKGLPTFASVMIILAALALGCRLPNFGTKSNSSDTSPSNTASKTDEAPSTTGPYSPSGDAKADLKSIADRFAGIKAFQAVMNGTGDKNDIQLELHYSAPDHYRMKTPNGDMIMIGKDTYMNIGGSWRKFPMDIGSGMTKMRQMMTEQSMKSVRDAEYIGDENVNGKDSMIYRYTAGGEQGTGKFTSKVWIARVDGLPQKIETEFDGGPMKSMLVTYSYNDIPVEVPAGK